MTCDILVDPPPPLECHVLFEWPLTARVCTFCHQNIVKTAAHKMLVKSTPGLNFTNIFTLSFYSRRSRKRKKTDDFTAYFTLLGYARVKAAHNMLVKSTPERNCQQAKNGNILGWKNLLLNKAFPLPLCVVN
jgi:hypothetical protein